MTTLALVVGLAVLPGPSPAQGRLMVAAASDLQSIFPALASRFERDTGIRVTTSFGSSGNFFAQIQNGAPYDLYFSADIDYPRRLAASGHADATSLYLYATGRIVLWTRAQTGIDVHRGLSVVRDARVRRIAIANPDVAPYGRAAVAALRSARLYDEVRSKLVVGENLSQAAQLADSGNADVAILSHSLAVGPALRRSGIYAQIPAGAHPPIEQAAVVVSASKNKAAARRFLAYVKEPRSQELLRQYGLFPAERSGR